MSTKIREFNEDYLIVVLSNNCWELYFNELLADTLIMYGSQLIREFKYEYS